jgi:hypothetical protein
LLLREMKRREFEQGGEEIRRSGKFKKPPRLLVSVFISLSSAW